MDRFAERGAKRVIREPPRWGRELGDLLWLCCSAALYGPLYAWYTWRELYGSHERSGP